MPRQRRNTALSIPGQNSLSLLGILRAAFPMFYSFLKTATQEDGQNMSILPVF